MKIHTRQKAKKAHSELWHENIVLTARWTWCNFKIEM